MAIHVEQQNTMQRGVVKQIDESGIMMVFDTLQKYQYSFPIKSTTRELLCNGIDSVMEKRMAREILLGRAKVEDYFVDIEGSLYKDSKFDKDYYDLNWLAERDDVSLQYIVGTEMKKDQAIFRDYGVGLGGKRLEGYFKLCYSTKRLSKMPLGKWGLGAKSPLSIGIEYYIMESRYNGKLFRFQIYNNTYYSIVPKLNMETGKINEHVVFNAEDPDPANHYIVHYEATEEKNSVTLILDAKKHHKQQYVEAVKSQMLYFEGITLSVLENDHTEVIPYQASILYEDDLIVMSSNNYYSKPHLLLNKVNYGYIDWSELELQDIQGNIGIKVLPEEIDVNPSRESVLWTEKTKEKVLKRFDEVVTIAEKQIQEELKETDFLRWIKTCYAVSSRYGEQSGIVGRLAKIVDLSRVKLKFGPDKSVHFAALSPIPGVYTRFVIMDTTTVAGRTKRKVERSHVFGLGNYVNLPFILLKQGEKVSNRKDKYLLSLYPNGFIQAHEPYDTFEQMEKAGLSEDLIKFYNKTKMAERRLAWNLLSASLDPLSYEAIEVPETFKGTDEEEEASAENQTEEDQAAETVARLSADERRKLEGKIIVNTPVPTGDLRYPFSFKKLEAKISTLNNWEAPEIYYGFDVDTPLLEFVSLLTADYGPRPHASSLGEWVKMKWYRLHSSRLNDVGVLEHTAYDMKSFFDTKVMLVRTAQSNARYYRDFKRITEFFIQTKNNTITMSNTLIQWNTARIVREHLNNAAFLFNFSKFHSDFSYMYGELCAYVERHFRDVKPFVDANSVGSNTYTDLVKHLDNVQKFQEFVAKGRPADEIASLAQELFANRELKDGMAIEPEIMAMLEELIEYSRATGPLLNYIPLLTGYISVPRIYERRSGAHGHIPDELEMEVKLLLEQKGISDYKTRKQTVDEETALLQVPVPGKGTESVNGHEFVNTGEPIKAFEQAS